jgi:hypothetical protein
MTLKTFACSALLAAGTVLVGLTQSAPADPEAMSTPMDCSAPMKALMAAEHSMDAQLKGMKPTDVDSGYADLMGLHVKVLLAMSDVEKKCGKNAKMMKMASKFDTQGVLMEKELPPEEPSR